MNNNQKKQSATILTTISSIIASAVLAGIIKGDINVGILATIGIILLAFGLYIAAILVLRKEKTNE